MKTEPTSPRPDTFSIEPPFEKPKFDGLVLVCGQCQKRSSGPSKITAKDVRRGLKDALGKDRFRLKIAQSSCLGVCPRKAIAVAAASKDGPAVMASVRNDADVATVANRLGGTA